MEIIFLNAIILELEKLRSREGKHFLAYLVKGKKVTRRDAVW